MHLKSDEKLRCKWRNNLVIYLFILTIRIEMRHLVFFIFITQLFFLTSSRADEFGEVCLQKGGQLRGRGCFCKGTNRFIDPYAEICLSKAIESFLEIDKLKKQSCFANVEGLPVATGLKEHWVEESELCSNPAKYICDKSLNPSIAEDENAQKLFDQIERDADKNKKVRDYILEKSKGSAEKCLELDMKHFVNCVKLRNQIMSERIYTEARKKTAQELFSKAKTAMIEVLEKRARTLEAMGLQGARSNLNKMKDEINEAQLFLGEFGSDDIGSKLSYNATAVSEVQESPERWYHFLTRGRYTNTVFLGGIILHADANPQNLYFTLLHELSHFIDLRKFRGGDDYTGHPFQNELMCLKRDDSASAKNGDYECFETVALKYKNKNSDFSRQVQSTAKDVRNNPDVEWQSPDFPKGETKCQMGQLGEMFADWMATEVFVRAQQLPSVASKTGLYQRNNQRIINLQERFAEIPNITEQVAFFCRGYHLEQRYEERTREEKRKDSHPADEDRLNGILLAHPLIKFSLGCSPQNVNNLGNLKDPTLEKGRVYCGGHLYHPLRGEK